jgi:hypothetical protein
MLNEPINRYNYHLNELEDIEGIIDNADLILDYLNYPHLNNKYPVPRKENASTIGELKEKRTAQFFKEIEYFVYSPDNECINCHSFVEVSEEDVQLLDSERIHNNLVKEMWLNDAVQVAPKILGVVYRALYPKHAFSKGQKIVDFYLLSRIIDIEDKNWNCVNYSIDYEKANTQILSRFNYKVSRVLRILIISKPKWDRGVKEYLLSKGIIIIELGFFVDPYTHHRAIKEIVRQLYPLLETILPKPQLVGEFPIKKFSDMKSLILSLTTEDDTSSQLPIKVSKIQIILFIIYRIALLHRATEKIDCYSSKLLCPGAPGPPSKECS